MTAGHDSPFEKALSIRTGVRMSPVLEALGVRLVIRSVALGNNPIYPYDICVKTYCGPDSDIIHWEQSYFGDFNSDHVASLEQFIRQASLTPSHPLIAFTDSGTPNW